MRRPARAAVSAARGRDAGVAVSSSLPSGSIFELAILPPPNAKVAVLLIDPVSTGAVLCHQLVTRRDASVIVVYSDAL